MVDVFVFVYVSSVVAAMVKADASAFAEAEAVVAVVVRNWALRPVLRVPLYARSDICVRLQFSHFPVVSYGLIVKRVGQL